MTDTPELPPLPEPLPAMEWQHNMLTADQTRAYARAYAAEAVRVALGWRPIETAPRDGRRVLAWIADTNYTGPAFAKLWFYSTDGRLGGGAEGFNGDWNITHWMPIAAAPKDHT